jgi:hypothetical protein
MAERIRLAPLLLIFALMMGVGVGGAKEVSVRAKEFPGGFFYRYQKVPIKEKARILARIDATLQKLNGEGYGLIAKGAVLEKPDPGVRVYRQRTILDGSGLVMIARQVPNLYYRHQGQLNPNIYIIIKNVRVNFPESYIRYGFVVEGDFAAYARKFVSAILEGLEGSLKGPGPRPR